MRALDLLGLMVFISSPAKGQWWADAAMPIDYAGEIGALYVDTTTNTMYCTGFLVQDWALPEQSFRFTFLQNGSWSLSPPLSHYATSIVSYQDTLYAAGAFTYFDSVSMPHVARLVDGVWQPCGVFDSPINRLRVVDGELYALGTFTEVDGLPCKGLAKRSGSTWVDMGMTCSTCYAYDLVKYQDRLVASGVLIFPGYRHVVQLVDGQWLPVGEEGIYGGLSGGGSLALYQGDLYVGGLIPLSAGNAGHALMRWDGTAWQQVGEGLQDETGGAVQSIKVQDLLVHEGLLYVSGGFTYAGNVPAARIATWNGIEWCSIGGDFGEYEVTAMAFYNDTLYVGCWEQVDGFPVNGVAKFIAPAFENSCSGNQTVSPLEASAAVRLVDQGTGLFMLQGYRGQGNLRVYSTTGQLVAEHAIQGEGSFNLSGLAPGVYLASLPQGWRQRLVVQR